MMTTKSTMKVDHLTASSMTLRASSGYSSGFAFLDQAHLQVARSLHSVGVPKHFVKSGSCYLNGQTRFLESGMMVLADRGHFEYWLNHLITVYHAPLKDLLSDLRDILREGYKEHRYADAESLYARTRTLRGPDSAP